MKVENGKIVEATENELFCHYLDHGFDDIFPFPEFLARCQSAGTTVIPEPRTRNAPCMLVAGYDKSHNEDLSCLVVFRKEGDQLCGLKHFYGDEADALYKRLTGALDPEVANGR